MNWSSFPWTAWSWQFFIIVSEYVFFFFLFENSPGYRLWTCAKVPGLFSSSFYTTGRTADAPALNSAIVPHCVKKKVPLLPEMSQLLLTLLHRREHLTLTQCSLGLCLICIGALFSFSRQTLHWCSSLFQQLEEMNSNTTWPPCSS